MHAAEIRRHTHVVPHQALMRFAFSRSRPRSNSAEETVAVPIHHFWQLPAGFETSWLVTRRAKRLGTALGRSGAPPRVVATPDGPGPRHILGLIGVRQQLARTRAAVKLQGAQMKAAAIPGRQAAAQTVIAPRRARVERISSEDIPRCEHEIDSATAALEDARRELHALPFLERGILNSTPLLSSIGLSVATFDAAVVYQILTAATLGSDFVRIAVTVGVPIVILAINHVAGVLAAVFARASDKRRKLRFAGLALLAMGSGVLLFAILLAIFRHQAFQYDAKVSADVNVNIGTGGSGLGLISPWWLAPLQLVASCAAVCASTFHTLGIEGRRRRKARRHRAKALATARGDLRHTNAELDRARQDVASAEAAIGTLTAEQDRAKAAISSLQAQDTASFDAERALGDACVALLQSHYEIGAGKRRDGPTYRRFVTSPVAGAMITAGVTAALAGAGRLFVALIGPLVGMAYGGHVHARTPPTHGPQGGG